MSPVTPDLTRLRLQANAAQAEVRVLYAGESGSQAGGAVAG